MQVGFNINRAVVWLNTLVKLKNEKHIKKVQRAKKLVFFNNITQTIKAITWYMYIYIHIKQTYLLDIWFSGSSRIYSKPRNISRIIYCCISIGFKHLFLKMASAWLSYYRTCISNASMLMYRRDAISMKYISQCTFSPVTVV